MRALVMWCPDWRVLTACRQAGIAETDPVALVSDHRVVACSTAARRFGVEPGMRPREASATCPALRVLPPDPDAEAAGFEPVVAALEGVATGVEVLRPGWCGLAAQGPARWFGGEAAAAESIVEHLAQTCDLEVRVGIADGFWPAAVAALDGVIVPRHDSRRFLADRDIELLAIPNLIHLLRRLGIDSLGQFAGLPRDAIATRLGSQGLTAHSRAAGHDERLPAPRTPPPDLSVSQTYDEPLERLDAAAFAARALAERLRAALAARELACTRIAVEATTVDGASLRRVWHHETVLRAHEIAERLRWQLDGWLTHGHRGPIVRLRLSPEDTVDGGAVREGLWAAKGAAAERAHRSAMRVQDLTGPEQLRRGVANGGRGVADRVATTAWNRRPVPGDPLRRPWPNAYPGPYPVTVHPDPPRVRLVTEHGADVTVGGHGALSDAPGYLLAPEGARIGVSGWAGPQTLDDRWWETDRAHRAARLQLLLADGRAVVIVRGEGVWRLEAEYD